MLDNFSLHFRLFTSLDSASPHFSMVSSTLYFLLIHLSYHFPYPSFMISKTQEDAAAAAAAVETGF